MRPKDTPGVPLEGEQVGMAEAIDVSPFPPPEVGPSSFEQGQGGRDVDSPANADGPLPWLRPYSARASSSRPLATSSRAFSAVAATSRASSAAALAVASPSRARSASALAVASPSRASFRRPPWPSPQHHAPVRAARHCQTAAPNSSMSSPRADAAARVGLLRAHVRHSLDRRKTAQRPIGLRRERPRRGMGLGRTSE